MKRTAQTLASGLLVALGAVAARAQGDGRRPDRAESKPAKPPAWPKLRYARKSLAKTNIWTLVSADAKKAARSRKLIVSYGAGVCPVLLDAIHARQKPEIRAAVESLLDELTTPAHAKLLRLAYNPKNVERSLYVIRRLASFELDEMLDFFRLAGKAKDPRIADASRFAIARLGHPDALPFLFELAKTSWNDRSLEVRRLLPAFKAEKTTAWLIDKLHTEDMTSKLAALRLLGGAGGQSAVPTVATFLDSSEHLLRIEAINALRGIVDGNPPFKHLSVFQAIDEVKRWKRKVGR